MIARMQKVKVHGYTEGKSYSKPSCEPDRDLLRVNYYKTCISQDPCTDPSLLDPRYASKHEKVQTSVRRMMQKARDNRLEGAEWERLNVTVQKNTYVFHVSF